jgi:hypothetical protein
LALVSGVLLPLALSSCTASPAGSSTSPTPARPPISVPVGKPGDGSALKTLATLPVKGRAPKTGYDRAKFGPAWSDDVAVQGGRNGCDTRNDVLRRDLQQPSIKPGTRGCVVVAGVLDDAYSGRSISFKRGQDTSSDVQIDHVVALANAWQTGAQQLTQQRRDDLGNDPLNLWAVSGQVNQQKGAGDAATWLPPNTAIRCRYVARQIAVKASYGLWVTQAERDAMKRVLDRCPTHSLPTATEWTIKPPVAK